MGHAAQVLRKPHHHPFRRHNLDCHLYLADQLNLIRILSFASDVVYGHLDARIFEHAYRQNRDEKLGGLTHLLKNKPPAQHKQPRMMTYLDFQIKILHTALTQAWRIPALCAQENGELIWHTGNNRFLATGMLKRPPAEHFPAICVNFDRKHHESNWQDLSVIATDWEFCEILGIDPKRAEPQHEVHIEWDQHAGPVLHYIKLGNENLLDWSNHADLVHMPGLMKVLEPYRRKMIPIEIWASDSVGIADSSTWFDVTLRGAVPPSISSPDSLTKYMRQNRNGAGWCLAVLDKQHVDLGEFLFWLEPTRNLYYDVRKEFVLITGDQYPDAKLIGVSDIGNLP